MGLHHDATGRTHVEAQIVMQDRGDSPLAEQRQVVGVKIMADEDPARARHRVEDFDNRAVAAPDRICRDDVRVGGQSLSHQRAGRPVDAEAFADLDDAKFGIARSQRPAETDLALFLAAEAIAA